MRLRRAMQLGLICTVVVATLFLRFGRSQHDAWPPVVPGPQLEVPAAAAGGGVIQGPVPASVFEPGGAGGVPLQGGVPVVGGGGGGEWEFPPTEPQRFGPFEGMDVLDLIDPLIGTAAGGHVFAGATLPFGMAKAVADSANEAHGGFSSEGTGVVGFSHMHDSGSGGSYSMGNFPIWPISGCPFDDINLCTFDRFSRRQLTQDVTARPGYFSVCLDTGIKSEMTTSNRTALYKFTFPPTEDATAPFSPMFLAALEDLPGTRKDGGVLVDAKTGRITGNGTFNPSFGIGEYTSFFCADFRGADVRDNGVYMHMRASDQVKTLRAVHDGINGVNGWPALAAGAWVRFNPPRAGAPLQLSVRVGVSFVSAEQACRNAEREIPEFDFEGTRAVAESAWREKMRPVEVDTQGVELGLVKSFWSGIYRTFISPQDYTGENPLWKSDEPYYDSFYCIWDSFRSIHPLLILLDPKAQAMMVRSLIDTYRHAGYLPDCRMSLCKGFTQGGSNADVVLVDSWLKGIKEGIDWNVGYEAMIKDAEVEPLNWAVEGRGGLHSWKELGYIPVDDFDPYGSGARISSVSRTVEYAYDDFCIAQMAKGIGKMDDFKKYSQRAGNWKNLFNPNQTSQIREFDTGFEGFVQPRMMDGQWIEQNPAVCSLEMYFEGCYLNPGAFATYEGSPWLYTLYAPGHMADLISTLGGPDSFVKRLDYFHDTSISYIGDEQAFLTVFLYHYAGRPGLSAKRAHYYIPQYFNATVVGLPGNDDAGAMGSFLALTMMGIFPNAGQDVYFITPPFFPSISITSPLTGKKATIRNVNFDPTYKNIYIQGARLGGKPYMKSWIDHSFFLNGGMLELELGPVESAWGTRPQDLPPSVPLS